MRLRVGFDLTLAPSVTFMQKRSLKNVLSAECEGTVFATRAESLRFTLCVLDDGRQSTEAGADIMMVGTVDWVSSLASPCEISHNFPSARKNVHPHSNLALTSVFLLMGIRRHCIPSFADTNVRASLLVIQCHRKSWCVLDRTAR